MKWDRQYQINVSFIDDQHREWFKRVAQLGHAIETGQSREEMATALKFVVDYTQKHFGDEEAFMVEVKYPELDDQKKQHRSFEKYIVDVLVNLKKGKDIPPEQLYEFMSNWILQHIQEEDRKIGNFLPRAEKEESDDPDETQLERKQDALAVKLSDLAGLHQSELITEDELTSKKVDLLRQFAEAPSNKVLVDSISKLDKIKAYIEEGLLNDGDLEVAREQLAHTVNVTKELAGQDGMKAKMIYLKNLLDEKVIDEDRFATHKTEILGQM